MKNHFRNLASLSLIAATIFQAGCKEDTIINANVTPTVGNINVDTIPDTLSIWTKTVYNDSALTSLTPSNQLVVHGLGTVNDPLFGRTNAGIYLQVVPEKPNYTFSASNPTIGDAYLVLPYSGFTWGDTTATDLQSYNVYAVTEDLQKDGPYYSFTHKNYDVNPVGTIANVDLKKLRDSVNVLGANKTPHLRIKLSEAFKNQIVSLAATSGDNATFLSSFKGLYIASADTTIGKAIPYFVLNGANDYQRAAIQFFYHENGNTSDVKTAFFNFVTNTTAHYNRITRNYSNELSAAFNSGLQSDPVVYIQNLPGATLDLRFPTLKNLPAVVVNRAELVITKISLSNDPDGDKFFEPARLDAIGIDANGKKYPLLDRMPLEDAGASNFVDGTRREVALPGGITVTQYALNIPREVQRAITNKTDMLHLQVNGVQRFFGAYRMVAGGHPAQYKVSLRITYSKL